MFSKELDESVIIFSLLTLQVSRQMFDTLSRFSIVQSNFGITAIVRYLSKKEHKKGNLMIIPLDGMIRSSALLLSHLTKK